MAKAVKCGDGLKRNTVTVSAGSKQPSAEFSDKAFKQALKFVSKEEVRPILQHVLYEDDGAMVATDGFALIQIQGAWEGGKRCLFGKDSNGKEDNRYSPENYPDYPRVIPHADLMSMVVKNIPVAPWLKAFTALADKAKKIEHHGEREVFKKVNGRKQIVREPYIFKDRNVRVHLRMVSGFTPLVSIADCSKTSYMKPNEALEAQYLAGDCGAVTGKTDITAGINATFMVKALQAMKALGNKEFTLYAQSNKKDDYVWQPMLLVADSVKVVISPIVAKKSAE